MMMKTLIGFILLILLGITLVACGGAPNTPAEATEPPVQMTASPAPPTSTPVPATDTLAPPESDSSTEAEIDLRMVLPEGDPLLGELTALGYKCYSCHVDGGQDDHYGPRFSSTDNYPRVMERGEMRMADPAYNGKASTNLEYVIEAIFLPELFIAPGDWNNPNPMPTDYHETMPDTDLADILAWMDTFE